MVVIGISWPEMPESEQIPSRHPRKIPYSKYIMGVITEDLSLLGNVSAETIPAAGRHRPLTAAGLLK
ncbi:MULTISPECIES: hypothetical protein [unclassified Sinorhizobium]|uniref:hypothetical protein n=1 Tax=unclassified Sinorhizobium TaxID=2613772 RepID=UPI0035254865